MINSVTIAGHIGKEPELKTFSNGNYKLTFSVAIKKIINGENLVIWIPVECWDKQANFVSNFLKSGSFIVVQGRIDFSTWEDEQGKKKSRLYVVGERVESPKPKVEETTNKATFKAKQK